MKAARPLRGERPPARISPHALPLHRHTLAPLARVLPFHQRLESQPKPEDFDAFRKALDLWKARKIYPADVFQALPDILKAQAGSLAHQWDEEFIKAVYESLEKTMSEGITVREWLPKAQELLDRFGAAPNAPRLFPEGKWSPSYADLVFRNANQKAYSDTKRLEMTSPKWMVLAPYWQRLGILDGRIRPEHRALHGLVFAKSDRTAWKLWPADSWNCRCTAREITRAEFQRGGYRVTDAASLPDDLFPPAGWASDAPPFGGAFDGLDFEEGEE